MSKGGSPKETTTTTKQEPWAPIQPYLTQIAGQASDLYAQPRSYYPGSTVVPFAKQTTDALSGIEARARSGSPVTAAMQRQLQQTLGGEYLGGAPGNGLYGDIAGDADAARGVASGNDQVSRFLQQIMGGRSNNPASSIFGQVANDPGSRAGSDVMRRYTGGALGGERAAANDLATTGFDDPSSRFYRAQAAGGLTNGSTGTVDGVASGAIGNDELGGLRDVAGGGLTNGNLGTVGDFASGALTNNKLSILDRIAGGGLTNKSAGAVGDIASGALTNRSLGTLELGANGGISNDQTGTLSEMAAGGANPQLDAMWDKIAGKIGGQVDRNAALSGRTGSDTHQRLLQEGLSDSATSFYGQAYDADQNRRLSAGSQLAQTGEAAADRRLSAGSSLAGFDDAGLARRLSAGSTMAGIDAADMDRQASAGTALAGFGDSDLSRRLSAGTSMAGIGEAGLDRRASANTTLAGMGDSAASRRLSAGTTKAGLGESALDRRSQGAAALTSSGQFGTNTRLAATGLAGSLGGQDADIAMRAGTGIDTARSNANAQRLQAASGLAGTFSDDANRRMTAASSLSGNKLSALGLAGSLTGTAASGLNESYDSERQRQLQSMLFAPQAANEDYADLERLASVGGENEAQAGRELQDSMARYDFNQGDPSDRLNQLYSMLMGLGGTGSTGTATQPLYRTGSKASSALGGAAAGASIGGPWGAAAGGLLGLFGG